MPVVYMATNTVNGKRYIGATKFSLEARKLAHLKKCKSKCRGCPKFYAALKKYGPDNFAWMMLAKYETVEEAFAAEERLIAELKPEYNLINGGQAVTPHTNQKPVTCLEDGNVFDSIADAARHYSVHASHLANLCRGISNLTSCHGKHFCYFTKKMTEQERADLIMSIDMTSAARRKKIRKPLRNRLITDGKDIRGHSAAGSLKLSRPVVCVTTNENFSSISAAAVYYNVVGSTITAVCRGRRRTVGRLVFKYAEAA